jgi:hypothetical protein
MMAELEDDISIELTDDNFWELIDKGKWIVNFYDPDCMHCNLFKG